MNSGNVYATRKRRKPVQKTAKSVPTEGVKSNPSKRHRDRLNAELEHLASLLPFQEDVISKLDKLSVLRLSACYLRAKAFFSVALKSSSCKKPDGSGIHSNCVTAQSGVEVPEGEFLLQALNGFVLVVTAEGLVFYASPTVQDYLGFHQSDVLHQSVFDLIHTEDRDEFQRQLHWALNPHQPSNSGHAHGDSVFPMEITYYKPDQLPPENAVFLERNFICRLRCLLDNSSGFLAMNFQGRLKFLHAQNKKDKDGTLLPPQLALFAIASPLQSPSILEIRTKNLIFRTKHKLDFTPTGCDSKGQVVLGYSEIELCMRGSGYQFIHAADMLYCAENHIRMMKTGESGMTVFRLLAKGNRWMWVQANARLVYKNGRPDYIIATQRPLVDDEGAETLRKRKLKLPFNFATGEAVLYEASYSLIDVIDSMMIKEGSSAGKKGTFKKQEAVDSESLLGSILKQDESVYVCSPAPNTFSFERNLFSETDLMSDEWQGSALLAGNSSGLHNGQAQQNVLDSNDNTLDSGKNSELHNIMNHLGITVEDIESIRQDEFFNAEWDYLDNIAEIDVANEILSYVQESLNNRSDCMFSSTSSQNSVDQSSRLAAQQQQQQVLCQKMGHMQVNGLVAEWSSVNGTAAVSQHQPQQLDCTGLSSSVHESLYQTKGSAASSAHTQDFVGYQLPATVQAYPPNLTYTDIPSGLNATTFLMPDEVETYLSCLQQSTTNTACGTSTQPTMVFPQASYSGALSTYPYLPENQPFSTNLEQFNPMESGQEAFLSQFQSACSSGNLGETYTGQADVTYSQTPTETHRHHYPSEHGLYSEFASKGFI
ncbi:aryl hydrocarbon receptor-like [Protopterus annectens]|uniref:aryl hydrocarbon receptor-like n=1 Tax=Protopterus annectens TaxID=7888 RepID=UPI001CFADB8D|nr:aryl hydrocarbon receptor-like [Protopterus annectens]